MVQTERRGEKAGPVACAPLVYQDGKLRADVPLVDIDVNLKAGCLVWLDVERPSQAEMDLLSREFGLHPLAIADIRMPHQRPKMDQYDDSRLIVLFDAQLEPGTRGKVVLNELDIFVGPNYVITVHKAPIPSLAHLRTRWLERPTLVEPRPLGFLLYQIADGLIDDYFPIADALEAKIEDIEEQLFENFSKSLLRDIFAVRRDLLVLRRVLGPQRDVFNLLARRDDPVVDQTLVPYFTDVVDLLLRLTDTVDTQRELLSAALESYLTLQSNALNEIMKRLTALTVTIMLPTLIAGVYGMNFTLTPSQDAPWAFWYAIGLMVLVAAATLVWFRRRDWL